ncbi:MAG: NAD(P)/FAD-dependent oxidoreductase [Elusimicrobia bacterium]|nr:NAD(P)/FAD-dependent oxidoreductase [Elusimicrobiota bacterium]
MPDFDAVVIGSGAGGLTTALCLAQAGLKTAIFEQHNLPGGWCHSFSLQGYRFSPGVHYVGELEEGERFRTIYEKLGVSADMAFYELNPQGFEHIIVGQDRFDIPKGLTAYADRLKSRFPGEKNGIDECFKTIEGGIGKGLKALSGVEKPVDMLSMARHAPSFIRWGTQSAAGLIANFVRHPFLKAILLAQCGDHGLAPSSAPALIHAAIMSHYFNGAYYPQGGGGSIARAFILALKRAGGEIHTGVPVAKILIENGKAIGVRLADNTEIRSKHVVSNADPDMTFRRLIGINNLSGKLRRKLEKTRYSISCLSLFMAVDMDLKAAGFDSGNYWYYESPDIDGIYTKMAASENLGTGSLPSLFITITTLKDPSKNYHGRHTLEIFTFVNFKPFEAWADSVHGRRPAEYEAFKNRLKDAMLKAAAKIIPGIEEHVVFAEVGTPLTNLHFCAAAQGCLYGTEKSKWQIGPWSYPIRTEIENLYLCGQNTYSHGVMGVTISGLFAADKILECGIKHLLRHNGPPLKIISAE